MTASAGQMRLVTGLEPNVLDLSCAETNTRAVGALSAASTDSAGALLAAWLRFDPHDSVVTSPSVLGYEKGERFLAILEQERIELTEPPIPLQD